MAKFLMAGGVMLLAMLFITFVFAYDEATIVATDNKVSLDNATRNALNESVNIGHLRVNEEVTIDPQIARESFVRNYADSVGFKGGERYINLYYLNEKPIIASDAYTTYEGHTNFTNVEDTITRSRNVYIIEAKNLTR